MPAESREVTDTVVAVTGASSGIGAATARLLLEAGAKVAAQAGAENASTRSRTSSALTTSWWFR